MAAFLGLLVLLSAAPARADLYRWVDPQSGSVKFSSEPPPGSQAGVQVIPYRGAAPPRQPATSGAAALEARWRELLAEISAAPPGSVLQEQRVQELAAAGAELDRLDPAGAPERRAETGRVLQRALQPAQ